MTSTITFTVNGDEHTVGSDVSSDVMLLDYLRNYLQLRGTKYMCREGGCGSCMVTASKSSGEPSVAVNSCLVAITQCHGWDITTIEGLGNRKKGYHKIQTALHENNGSQCGYCSPGWCMSMYGLLNLTKSLKMLDIEKGLSSNLCRCTGYRPIIKAFKTFGSDAPASVRVRDIEDMALCRNKRSLQKRGSDDGWCMIKCEDAVESKTITLSDGKIWYRPTQLTEVLAILKTIDNTDYMLVGGNSAKGVSPINECPSIMIELNAISELKTVELDQNLIVGAGNTLTDFLTILDEYSAKDNFAYLKTIYNHVEKIAHIPVRNIGTIAGNLMIKHATNTFQSDLFLVLHCVGAEMTVVDKTGTAETLAMDKFLTADMQCKVITNILLRPLSDTLYKIATYKIMSRAQSSHAIVNGAFLFKLTTDNVVEECCIVYGALSVNFIRASTTESYLLNKSLFSNDTLQGAIKVLSAEIICDDHQPEPSVQFRTFLAKALLYKAVLSLCPSTITINSRYQSGITNLHDERGESSAVQTYPTDSSKSPLNQPIPKLEGTIQCAGEARYTDDIPTMKDEVFAAFVMSTEAVATIVKIDATEAKKLKGVVAFYTAEDIPGLNSFTPSDDFMYTADEEIFASTTVKYCHQPVGMIVAETQAIAERAAKLVTITYSNIKTPVIDIKEARSDSTRNTLYASVAATATGTDTVAKTITGTHTLYGQYHFTMETNVCVAKPTEDGIEVHSATQWIDGTHIMISRALGMEQNKIDVYVNRIGGGYGMKISRSIIFAVAASLAVKKLNRPCRFIAPLTTNTKCLGKRMPCVNDYTVNVNSSGVIQSIDTKFYEDTGYKSNEIIPALGVDVYYNCYDVTKFNYYVYNTVTDTPVNTWCRSPGTLEAIACTELTLERIAYELCLDPVEVRLANLDTTNFSTMKDLVTTLKTKAEYTTRRAAVDLFNSENRWKKKGLRFNFCRWAPAAYLKFDVNLSIYHADGTVVLTHSAVEMGQGINTKAAQMVAYFLGCSIDKIVVKSNNTINSPNAAICGGSLGTQSVCIAARRCCVQMNTRLEPIKTANPDATWTALIQAAYAADVDLQAHGYVGSADIMTYNVYGMACCEVTLDVLTGEFQIERLDMVQDVGFSLNPDLDIGQIEGALMMGIGYFTSEKMIYESTGELLTNRSWDIHLPEIRDIPKDLRVHILENSTASETILGAKGTGEPAICSSVVVALALREAIAQARQDSGISTSTWFDIEGPYLNEKMVLAASISTDDFKLT